jgi:hypothetical protein
METDNAYKTKPKNGARPVKSKKNRKDEDSDEEEDVNYGYKNLKKPKP